MASTWLNIAAAALAWIGAGALLLALFGDSIVQFIKRRRGTARPRCPRCFYDLTHAPKSEDGAMRCSECGRVAGRERQLYKGRRRWSLVWIALVVFLAAHVVNVLPGIRQRGPIAAVPTTAFILAMPWLGSPEPILIEDDVRGQVTINNEFSQEFFERLYGCGRMWRWQERMIVERALRGDRSRRPLSAEWNNFYGEALHCLRDCRPYAEEPPWLARAEAIVEIDVYTRPVWPAGVPIYARFALDRWETYRDHVVALTPLVDGLSDAQFTIEGVPVCGNELPLRRKWDDGSVFLGVPGPATEAIEYQASVHELDYLSDAAGRKLRRQTLRVPIRIVESIDDVLEAVESPELTEVLHDLLEPALLGSVTGDRFSLRLWRDSFFDIADAPPVLQGVTIALTMEALRNGEVMGAASAWFAVDGYWWPSGPVEMTWFDAREARFAEDAEWTLRLRSDPHTALRHFYSDRYWVGEIEAPLRIDVWAER